MFKITVPLLLIFALSGSASTIISFDRDILSVHSGSGSCDSLFGGNTTICQFVAQSHLVNRKSEIFTTSYLDWLDAPWTNPNDPWYQVNFWTMETDQQIMNGGYSINDGQTGAGSYGTVSYTDRETDYLSIFWKPLTDYMSIGGGKSRSQQHSIHSAAYEWSHVGGIYRENGIWSSTEWGSLSGEWWWTEMIGGTTINQQKGLYDIFYEPIHTSGSWAWNSANTPAPVPEPGTAFLLGTALVGVGLLGRRRKKKS